MDPRELKRILDALMTADVREFSLKTADYELNLRRGVQGQMAAEPAVPLSLLAAPPSGEAPVAQAPEPAPEPAPTASGAPVKAPIVGTFYAASSPEAAPFVKVGDRVEVGQVLCIIEAMKLMNEIESEAAGVVQQVLVKNADPVEYGQTLFVIG